MKKGRIQHDEAVSSVVGEMIMIALVVILVALFATSAFSLIPGGREASVDVAMKNKLGGPVVEGDGAVIFWHRGGDWVEDKDLTVIVIRDNARVAEYSHADFDLYGADPANVDPKEAFDLGGRLEIVPEDKLPGGLLSRDTIRLVTPKNVIFSGEVKAL